jgi:hypothetical protein
MELDSQYHPPNRNLSVIDWLHRYLKLRSVQISSTVRWYTVPWLMTNSHIIDEIKLRQLVDEFHIKTANGLIFWAPYIRNDNYTEDGTVPRGLGKSSPESITEAANYVQILYPDIDDFGIKRSLIDGSLPDYSYNYKGVDCSGFLYHILSRYCSTVMGLDLVDYLSVPKANVLNGAQNLTEWRDIHLLTDQEIQTLHDDVPMKWVTETFKRNAANLCSVRSLISDYSSSAVDIESAHAGDIVVMQIPEDPIMHAGIILRSHSDSVEIAHSGRRDIGDTGGVSIERISRGEDRINTEQMIVGRNFLGVRRLRCMVA